MVGVREEMAGEDEGEVRDDEGVMVTRVRARGQEWTAVAVYVNGDMAKKLKLMRKWMEGEKERIKREAGSRRIKRLMGKGGNC